MALQPGLPGSQTPAGPDWLVRRVQDLERELREVRASIGALTGMTFAQGAIKSATFDGNLDTPAAGTTGFALGGAHDTLIVNDLVLRGEIIGNEALVSPVRTSSYNDITSGFTWTTTFVAQASVTVTVPAGFTEANVLAIGHTGTTVAASPAGSIYLYSAVDIDGVGGSSSETSLMTSGGGITVSSAWARKLTGLVGGGTFDIKTYGTYLSASGGSVPATGSGHARVSAIVTFTR